MRRVSGGESAALRPRSGSCSDSCQPPAYVSQSHRPHCCALVYSSTRPTPASSSHCTHTHTHTHTQPFNDLLSGTTRVSQYQKNLHPLRPTRKKKDLHRQQGPLRRSSSPLRCFESALSQRVLLNPIKPAYNQSRPGGRLKLTASAFNRLWTSMPAVLPTATQNLLHLLSTSCVTARHLLGSMVQGKITEADAPTICLDTTTSGLLVHF